MPTKALACVVIFALVAPESGLGNPALKRGQAVGRSRERVADGLHLVKPRDLENQDISGDNALGDVDRELSKRLVVMVQDSQGLPQRNVPVRFQVLSEPRENRLADKPAQLRDTIAVTNAGGLAAAQFRFGGSAGEYRVEARLGESSLVYSLTARAKDWLVTLVFGLLGGLSFFLFGLYYGSKGLKRLAGNRLRELLFSLTRHRVLGLAVGIIVTVIFQSSSATTALLVSFATTGLLTLGQSLGVILGADIGTTLTVQLLAFRVFDYALTLTAIGFILMYSWRRVKDAGQAIFGFGLVFFSLKIVADATAPLKLDPNFPAMLEALGHAPVWGTLIAVVFTLLVRSSAATVGIAVGLAVSGLLNLRAAVPIILGANVGTALSVMVASVRGNAEARRIALGHVLFKLIIVIPLLFLIGPLVSIVEQTAGSAPRQIANAHTLINVFAALVFLPFLGGYERLIRRLVAEPKGEMVLKPRYLEPSLLEAPAVALGQATREVLRMGDVVTEMLKASLPVFLKNDKDGRHKIAAADDQVDSLEEATSSYLTELTREEMPADLSQRAVALFYTINELEHIGDVVSKGLMSYTKKKIDQNFSFSAEGLQEIAEFHAEVVETLRMAMAALSTWDRNLSEATAKRKEFGNQRLADLHSRHLDRLRQGLKESIDTSTIHLDFISDLERMNFHASAIGLAIAGAVPTRIRRATQNALRPPPNA
jgi:phosphate:Na+ symporter